MGVGFHNNCTILPQILKCLLYTLAGGGFAVIPVQSKKNDLVESDAIVAQLIPIWLDKPFVKPNQWNEGCTSASMDLIVTGYRPQRSNVWLVGHSVQSLNGSRGPGQPRAAFLQPGKAAAGQGRAGWRGSGNSNESPAKRRLQPRWAGGPVPAPSRPAAACPENFDGGQKPEGN